jgi:chromosome segregation ATPase
MLSVLLRSGDGRVVPTNQQEEIGMEATVEAPSAQTRKDYTSRPGALSRFFRMSRDGWKSKYKDLKATVKGYKNRLAHLTRSREQWRIRAERAGEQITTLEVEIAELRARLAALGGVQQKQDSSPNSTAGRTRPG